MTRINPGRDRSRGRDRSLTRINPGRDRSGNQPRSGPFPAAGEAAERNLISSRVHRSKPATVRMGCSEECLRGGHIAPEAVQRVMRANLWQLGRCFAEGKATIDTKGLGTLKLEIAPDGSVASFGVDGRLREVESCARVVGALTFPKPDGGSVRITYPIEIASAVDAYLARPRNGVDMDDVVELLAGLGSLGLAHN